MNKKKIAIVFFTLLAAALFITSLFYAARPFINHAYVTQYGQKDYSAERLQGLVRLNYPSGYVAYYNLGTAAYQNEQYGNAVTYFAQALTYSIPENRECSVRINYALSLVKTVDIEGAKTPERVNDAIQTLTKARDSLVETNCAIDQDATYTTRAFTPTSLTSNITTFNVTTHTHTEKDDSDATGPRDADAQKLKEEIDDLIEQLSNNGESDGEGESENNEEESSNTPDSHNDTPSDNRENNIQDKLEKERENAAGESERDRRNNGGNSPGGFSGDSGDGGNENGQGNSEAPDYKPW